MYNYIYIYILNKPMFRECEIGLYDSVRYSYQFEVPS